jgi:hypothetical protein
MRRNQKPTQLKGKSKTTCGCVVRNCHLLMYIDHRHTTFFLNRANLHKIPSTFKILTERIEKGVFNKDKRR